MELCMWCDRYYEGSYGAHQRTHRREESEGESW